MVALQHLTGFRQTVAVSSRFVPWHRKQRFYIAPGYCALRRLGREILQPDDLIKDFLLDFLLRLKLPCLLFEAVDLVLCRILAELLADHLELLPQDIFPLVLVDTLPYLFLDLPLHADHFRLVGEKHSQRLILILYGYRLKDELAFLIGKRQIDRYLAECIGQIVDLHDLSLNISADVSILPAVFGKQLPDPAEHGFTDGRRNISGS